MKVFMYDEKIINLAAVEKVVTSNPDKKSGKQAIWFYLRGKDMESIHVPISETKKILKIIFEEMRED